jgi:small subunit ribosomal protein S19e
MTTVYDVPQDVLITKLAEHLRHVSQVSPPGWTVYAKTGSHAEKQPAEKDWWYTRCASLLRKIYLHGPIGLSSLESDYGGRKALGYFLSHHRDGGGSAIRKAIRQLETADLVAKQGNKGRILTPKGVSLLDKKSTEIFRELVKMRPELVRYT